MAGRYCTLLTFLSPFAADGRVGPGLGAVLTQEIGGEAPGAVHQSEAL